MNLEISTAHAQMTEMLSGKKTTEEILRFLQEQDTSEKSVDQLSEYLAAIRETAQFTITASEHDLPLVDLSGTGGDKQNTANISTLASLVVASTDQAFVYKYGNRSASSFCGSMDVLEASGVDINLPPAEFRKADPDLNYVPVFARLAYPGAKHVADARKEFGKNSLFNLLFPLARPIQGKYSFLMGFAKGADIPLAAQIVQRDPATALLVHGQDGTDEISVTGNGITEYTYIKNGQIQTGIIDVESLFGIIPVKMEDLQVSDKADAIDIFAQVIDPNNQSLRVEKIRKAVLVNAAGALSVAHPGTNDIHQNLELAYEYVESALREGHTQQLLHRLQHRNK